jgi:hypothetical protein
MLKIRMDNGDLVLAITSENVSKLKKGEPIRIKHEDVGDTTGDIYLVYGDSMPDIVHQFKSLGLIPEAANVVIPGIDLARPGAGKTGRAS